MFLSDCYKRYNFSKMIHTFRINIRVNAVGKDLALRNHWKSDLSATFSNSIEAGTIERIVKNDIKWWLSSMFLKFFCRTAAGHSRNKLQKVIGI